jgi:hypothetical protein
LLVTIHLDYALKGTKEWQQLVVGQATGVGTLAGVVLDNCEEYDFSFEDVGGLDDAQTVHSVNDFKRNPGFGGPCLLNPDLGSAPLVGVKVEAWDSKGTTKIGEALTDVDGNYYIAYKHKAKAAEYLVKLPAYNKQQKVTIKANGFGYVEFIVP